MIPSLPILWSRSMISIKPFASSEWKTKSFRRDHMPLRMNNTSLKNNGVRAQVLGKTHHAKLQGGLMIL